MENNNLVLGNSHVLQGRQQNYVAVKRLITLHSEDRDSCKWPSASLFEVDLPEPITNVQSMRLVNVTFAENVYVFSREAQNTKMWIDVLEGTKHVPYEIQIQEGTYTPYELAQELQCRFRSVKALEHTEVFFDKVGLRFWFKFSGENSPAQVTFRFDLQNRYTPPTNAPTDPTVPAPPPCASDICWGRSVEVAPLAWTRCTKWGLGWYLGFNEREAVSSIRAKDPIVFGWRTKITDPNYGACSSSPTQDCCAAWCARNDYYIAAPCPAASRVQGDTAFYIEIDKYNMYDELAEQNLRTSSTFNRSGGGVVNAAFAKVAFTTDFGKRIIDPDQQGFQNVQQFEPPLENIRKLKFKLRHHDGRLVNFRGAPFDLTLELVQLRDEIHRQYRVRIPPLYK